MQINTRFGLIALVVVLQACSGGGGSDDRPADDRKSEIVPVRIQPADVSYRQVCLPDEQADSEAVHTIENCYQYRS